MTKWWRLKRWSKYKWCGWFHGTKALKEVSFQTDRALLFDGYEAMVRFNCVYCHLVWEAFGEFEARVPKTQAKKMLVKQCKS